MKEGERLKEIVEDAWLYNKGTTGTNKKAREIVLWFIQRSMKEDSKSDWKNRFNKQEDKKSVVKIISEEVTEIALLTY